MRTYCYLDYFSHFYNHWIIRYLKMENKVPGNKLETIGFWGTLFSDPISIWSFETPPKKCVVFSGCLPKDFEDVWVVPPSFWPKCDGCTPSIVIQFSIRPVVLSTRQCRQGKVPLALEDWAKRCSCKMMAGHANRWWLTVGSLVSKKSRVIRLHGFTSEE